MNSKARSEKVKAVARWLNDHDDIAIITHIQPDGDALGSSLAVMHALHSMGKRAFVCDQHPVPHHLELLPGCSQITTPDCLPFEPRAVLSVDCADEGRMGSASALLSPELPFAVIDHHETNPTRIPAALIDGDAAAAGVLVKEVLEEMNISLTQDIALCLYTAISTDTGNFNFANTNREAFCAAGDCVGCGLDIAFLGFKLFRARTAQRTKLLGRALNGIEYLADGKLALIRLTLQDIADCGATEADNSGIVAFGMDTEGVDAAILATERQGSVKFSVRSRGKINAAQVLAPLGGGGHAQAAGLVLHMPMEEAVQTVVSAVLPLL